MYERMRGDIMNFKFISELVKTDILVNNQEEAIYEVAQPLIQKGYVNEKYPTLVLEREKQYPTGLITSSIVIAIPHSFDEHIKGNHVAIGVLKNTVAFKNMEDIDQSIDVKIIFMLAIDKAKEQLEMLKILMNVFKENNLLNHIASVNDKEAICDALNDFVNQKNK